MPHNPASVRAVKKLFRDLRSCNGRAIASSGNIDIDQLAVLIDAAISGPHRTLVVRGIAEVLGGSIDGTALVAPSLRSRY